MGGSNTTMKEWHDTQKAAESIVKKLNTYYLSILKQKIVDYSHFTIEEFHELASELLMIQCAEEEKKVEAEKEEEILKGKLPISGTRIFEGRGKGATWTLLLETLRNEGVYITAGEQQKKIATGMLNYMLIEGVISEHGKEYLKKHILHINEIRSRGHWGKKKFYVDLGLEILERYIAQETAHRPEIIALGNDDEQIVHPRFFRS